VNSTKETRFDNCVDIFVYFTNLFLKIMAQHIDVTEFSLMCFNRDYVFGRFVLYIQSVLDLTHDPYTTLDYADWGFPVVFCL